MTNGQEDKVPPVEIDPGQLSPEAFAGIIENFILREGTDYGVHEVAFDKKADQLRKQIERGDLKIVFDPQSETVTLMTKRDWLKLNN